MKKVTYTYKKKQNRLEIKGTKIQELNGREYQDILNGKINGLLRLDIERYEPIICFGADLRGLIPLNEFLGLMPLTRRYFSKLLRNILQTLTAAEERHFNKNLFIYDPCFIFVEPASWQFYFTYIPLQPYETGGNLRDLLDSLMQYATFETAEDTSYVQDYIQILNNGPLVSLFVLEEYIRYLEAGIKKKTNQGSYGGLIPARASLIEIISGQRIPITTLPFKIGSQPDSDMIPNTAGISRKHAELQDENGQYVLIDTGSRNGTFVNGKRLFPGVKELIHAGDHIGFAGAEYRFHSE